MRNDIVDFHAHPYLQQENNYCFYKDGCLLEPDAARERLERCGIAMVCGSVLSKVSGWEDIVKLNDTALELRERWGEFYVPGFHVHPDYAEQSLAEVERMAKAGVKLMGELVPYMQDWSMSHPGLIPILEAARAHGMVVSYHSTGVTDEVMEPILDRFPDMTFVAAHPREKKDVLDHIGLMQRHKNYYLDLSGGGLGRMGLLRFVIDRAGADRILFGTDFPICPPEMYVAAVEHDPLLTEEEKQAIFRDNARRILFGA